MIRALYKLATLSDEVRAINKIRSKVRLDCVGHAQSQQETYKGLINFINSKGQLFFYKTPARDFVNTDSKRIAEWSLTNNSQNLSSIYIEDIDYPQFGYGYPNAKRLLSNGEENPLFNFRNDGYLFILSKDYSEIEILIIQDGRNLISSYYQLLIDGALDNEINELRNEVKPFFNYEGLL